MLQAGRSSVQFPDEVYFSNLPMEILSLFLSS
jgi:hypothetical protein